MRRHILNTALGNRSQGQNTRFPLDPIVTEQAVFEKGQQIRQNLVAELHRQHIQRSRTALAQIPAASFVIQVVVQLVFVPFVVVVVVKVGINRRARLVP